MVHDLSRTSGSTASSRWSNGVKSKDGRRDGARGISSSSGSGMGLDLGDSRVLGRPSMSACDDVTAELDALRRTGRIPDQT